MNRYLPAILLLAVLPLAEVAAEVPPEVERTIRNRIEGTLQDVSITRIMESPVPGLYQVQLGVDVIYTTGDGRYVLRGDLLDLQQKLNHSDVVRKKLRSVEFSGMDKDEYIEFAPEDGGKHTLYVFTDVRCSYCRRLHGNIKKINSLGIAVRYLAFPVIGNPQESVAIMERVWCAPDRSKALTLAKAGDIDVTAAAAKCKNPVRKQFQLGRDMGVNGTPAMYLEDGTELPGYMEPQQILQQFSSS